jgi:hypothetical protein
VGEDLWSVLDESGKLYGTIQVSLPHRYIVHQCFKLEIYSSRGLSHNLIGAECDAQRHISPVLAVLAPPSTGPANVRLL